MEPEEADDHEIESDVDEEDGDTSLAPQEDEDSKDIKNDQCKCSYNIIWILF